MHKLLASYFDVEMLTIYSVLFLEIICLLAYFIKGFSGFGPAPIFVPSTSIIWSPSVAIPSSAVINVLVGSSLLVAIKPKREDTFDILDMSIFMGVGTFIGASLLDYFSETIVLFIISLFVLFFGIYFLIGLDSSEELLIKPGRLFLRTGCFIGGFTGGLVGVSGPFVVFAGRPLMNKSKFRRILISVFFLEEVFKILAYSTYGILNDSIITIVMVALPAIVLGTILGHLSHFSVGERLFSIAIGATLTAISLITLINAI